MGRKGGYSEEGLKELALLVQRARGGLTYRNFESHLQAKGIRLSHATLWRLEIGEARIPDPDTLRQIAAAIGWSPEELDTLLSGQMVEKVRENAKSLIVKAGQLSNAELAELIAGASSLLADRLSNG